jgi:hypothetical protein
MTGAEMALETLAYSPNIMSFAKSKPIRWIGMQYTRKSLEIHIVVKSENLNEGYDLGNFSANRKITLI